ncbi:APC family permease [Nevskia soli]|uniref:APC family permease n=1 Tax=Nevskia soli TaxID=418856 RepID=UPI0015D6A6BB|nr:APC family permease [Nevskia soli]
MSIIDLILGRPLASSDERAQQIGVAKGIPIFGLDALSSAAYGPEAALTLLIPLGLAGVAYIVPLSTSIIALLVIVFFSYRQTIAAYPNGGGSYTVARENLGTFPGLVAAAALMIDYVLTAAVGISAGIGALTSAVPSLHARTLELCLGALVIITLVNLRGLSEAGGVFLLPTYLFLGCMVTAIAIGVFQTLASGGNPHPIIAPPAPAASGAMVGVSVWLIMKAFASGCTALTGVEAVSNGVKAFREPTAQTAQRTLGLIIAALIIMLAGIAFLVRSYHIVATDPNGNSYQSILSMLFLAVSGRGWFYYTAIASVLLVLVFSANTAFADFPRVCRAIAEDFFLPISLATRGRRLVYSQGVLILAALTGALLIGFGGVTDRLIPLYAVGAFLAFTLSQAGMVAHWLREKGPHAIRNMIVNAIGAIATGATVLVVIAAKFVEGAWITVIAIPALLALMYGVRRHYDRVHEALASPEPLELGDLTEPLVIVPLQQWSKIAKHALCLAFSISKNIRVLFVASEDCSDELHNDWNSHVSAAAQAANAQIPELILLPSPYRFVVQPIADYILQASKDNPGTRIIAIVPELIEQRWYNYFLHSQRATLLKALLLLKGNNDLFVMNVPWYFK